MWAWFIVLHGIVLYCVVLDCIVLHGHVLYCIVLNSRVLYRVVLYCFGLSRFAFYVYIVLSHIVSCIVMLRCIGSCCHLLYGCVICVWTVLCCWFALS